MRLGVGKLLTHDAVGADDAHLLLGAAGLLAVELDPLGQGGVLLGKGVQFGVNAARFLLQALHRLAVAGHLPRHLIQRPCPARPPASAAGRCRPERRLCPSSMASTRPS